MRFLNIMDPSGHTSIEYERGTESEEEAKRKFADFMDKRYNAFDMTDGNNVQIKAFNTEATEILMVPAFQGG